MQNGDSKIMMTELFRIQHVCLVRKLLHAYLISFRVQVGKELMKRCRKLNVHTYFIKKNGTKNSCRYDGIMIEC